MNYTVRKTDSRFTWYQEFEWIVQFPPSHRVGSIGILEFDRCCKWCNQTWGWGQEAEVRHWLKRNGQDYNLYWAHSVVHNKYRIYLSSDRELAWLQLGNLNS